MNRRPVSPFAMVPRTSPTNLIKPFGSIWTISTQAVVPERKPSNRMWQLPLRFPCPQFWLTIQCIQQSPRNSDFNTIKKAETQPGHALRAVRTCHCLSHGLPASTFVIAPVVEPIQWHSSGASWALWALQWKSARVRFNRRPRSCRFVGLPLFTSIYCYFKLNRNHIQFFQVLTQLFPSKTVQNVGLTTQ